MRLPLLHPGWGVMLLLLHLPSLPLLLLRVVGAEMRLPVLVLLGVE